MCIRDRSSAVRPCCAQTQPTASAAQSRTDSTRATTAPLRDVYKRQGMDLSQGGHLTHGSPVNMSGKNYNFVSYGVNADGCLLYTSRCV